MSEPKLHVIDKETADILIKRSLDKIRAAQFQKSLRDFENEVIPFLDSVSELAKKFGETKNDWKNNY
ncbi:hypothetical protein FDG95_gp139 [Pectobacterium phage vB_PcaM_CBB]|uniref:Uncharacterized protein n=1 Tax=Pectobacterium phage vB_PcaM_CBB TaxID=2772511 RepID=A0A1L2CUL1_9CAUD|nr:hypothetical protein FDG95_gp139 [Pectobacterium phage vB_PcaM_CBB]AMM43704.1 hypothetical protein CBB_139 [Pectobacterium phage vB_PcaM_CBB]